MVGPTPLLIQADARHLPLPDQYVQCVVTSPPYWGLRDYGEKEQIGLEQTPEEYVQQIVAVFREVRRVLRDDGTCWLNLGDSYTSGGRKERDPGRSKLHPAYVGEAFADGLRPPLPDGLKPKDLVGIPWRVAFALQADGWYLRSDIIWAKPNPMPESVTDRPTRSHEYLFLLTKNERYFYDAEAVRESSRRDETTGKGSGQKQRKLAGHTPGHRVNDHLGSSVPWEPDGSGRNRRSVWTIDDAPAALLECLARRFGVEAVGEALLAIAEARRTADVWTITPRPYRGAHFATFPPELVEPCIKAGTPEGGCCPSCGAPFRRVIEKGGARLAQQQACGGDADGTYDGVAQKDYESAGAQDPSAVKSRILAGMVERRTVGWQVTCRCSPTHAAASVVLDPFAGSGTTGQVAKALGRFAILCERKAEYLQLARERCA